MNRSANHQDRIQAEELQEELPKELREELREELQAEYQEDSQAAELAAIVDEYRSRIAAGEAVDVESLAARMPGADQIVREVLESLKLVHQFGEVATQPVEMPRIIGEFEILQEIGRGGMGIVYRARQQSLDRIVALKILPFAASFDRKRLERFRIETHSASILQHPNILAIYGTGCDQGVHYYAMQYIDGKSIQDHLQAERTFDVCETAAWIRTVAEALQHAHRSGVVHRDIKPSNLLLDSAGKIWITDFGLAQMDNQATLTLAGDLVGTLRYMSPEQTQEGQTHGGQTHGGQPHEGRTPIDHRTDIYALGATLFEMLTGTPMISGAGRLEIMRNVMEQEARFPKATRRVPRDLQTIVLKATAKDRELRYASAAAMADDLQRYLDGRPILACRPGIAVHTLKLAARHPLLSIAVTILPFIVMLGVLLYNMVISAQKREVERALEVAQQNESKAVLEARKAKAVSELLQQLVASANPDQTKGAEYTVRQLLDDLSESVFEELGDQPEVAATLRTTIGNAYRRLGSPERALDHLQKALEHHERHASAPVIAHSYTDLAWNYAALGKYTQAIEYARRAVDIHARQGSAHESVQAMWCLQHCLMYAEQYDESDRISEQAIQLARTLTPLPSEIANIVHDLAQSKTRQGKADQGITLAHEAIELHQRLQGDQHPELGWGYEALGRALLKSGKPNEAATAFQNALTIFEANYPQSHKSVRMTLELLEDAYELSHRTEDLSKLQHQLLSQRLGPVLTDSSTRETSVLTLLSKKQSYLAAGELVMLLPELFESPKSVTEALQVLSQYKQMLSQRTGATLPGDTLEQLRKTTQTLINQAIHNCPNTLYDLNTLAWNIAIASDPDFRQPKNAVELAQRATKIDPSIGACWNTLGLAYLRAGQTDDAISALHRSQTFATTDEYDTVLLAIAHAQRGEREIAQQHLEDAQRQYKARQRANPEMDQFISEAEELLKP